MKNRRTTLLVSTILLVALTACTKSCSSGGGTAGTASECRSSTDPVTALSATDTTIGGGAEAVVGKTVKVHYTGTFMDCKKFDSSIDRGEPFPFQLGSGMVIPGWDQGVVGMKVGGKRILLVPYALAYGEAGHPGGIPPKSDLRFEVELIAVD